jgi:SAM-dependent methyltransferase
MEEMDNQVFYNDRGVVQYFDGLLGWIDRGEQTAVLSVAPFVRGKRILDIGVGAGRTVGIISLLSDSYVGIDYATEMVSACQHRYPWADIRWGDARDLSSFADRNFDLALFSFNGIGSLDESGRTGALTDIHRVLDRGGFFVFSIHNKDGPSYGETPFQLHRPGQRWDRSPRAAARFVWRNATHPTRIIRRYRNWLRAKPMSIEGDGSGMSSLLHGDFTLLNSFLTIERTREELREVGFEVIDIYNSGNSDIRSIPPETKWTDTDWLHVVARKSEVLGTTA